VVGVFVRECERAKESDRMSKHEPEPERQRERERERERARARERESLFYFKTVSRSEALHLSILIYFT
jgi:hypothetical protein